MSLNLESKEQNDNAYSEIPINYEAISKDQDIHQTGCDKEGVGLS